MKTDVFFISSMMCWIHRAYPKRILSKSEGRRVLRSLYPNVSHPSVEHVVPVSIYRNKASPTLAYDLHNLLVLPTTLNVHRSNYTFAPAPSEVHPEWIALDALGRSASWSRAHAFKHNGLKLFCPPCWCRGIISRKAAYFRHMYPEWSAAVEQAVLPQHLMEAWNAEYPVTEEERRINLLIRGIQRNTNPFVESPEFVHWAFSSSSCT